jgi:hypothetical protein
MEKDTSKALEWTNNPFWFGFMCKAAGMKNLKGILPSMGKPKVKNVGLPVVPGSTPVITPEMPAEVKRMADNVARPGHRIKPATEALDYSKKPPVTPSAPKIKPAAEPINYAKMNAIPKTPESQAGTVEYGPLGVKGYKKPPKAPDPAA